MTSEAPPPPAPVARRLHPAGIAVAALAALRENAVPLVLIAGLTVLGGGAGAESLLRLAAYAVLATLVAIVVGYVRWATTTYWLDGDAIHLKRGVLQRQQAAVPVGRITSVDTVQGPVQRLLGVIELQVQAAGGGEAPEISLAALSDGAAAEVRAYAARSGVSTEAPPAASPVRRLSRRALLVAALTSGQFTVLLPVLAALSQGLDDVLRRAGGGMFERYLPPETATDALVALGVLLAAAWLLAIGGTIVAFSGFRVARDGNRVRIMRGLVQRRVSTIPIDRIQAVRVVEGVLRQPLGLVSVRVESAGYAGERSVNTTLFPLLPRAQLQGFLRAAVPEFAAPLEPLERPPTRAWLLYVGAPVALALAAAVPLALLVTPLALALAIPPLAAALGTLRQRDAGWRLGEGFLVARSRRLARTTILAAGFRLPERTFAQGPVARRLGLATLAFALASRTRWQIPHLEAVRVRGLLDALRPSAARAPAG